MNLKPWLLFSFLKLEKPTLKDVFELMHCPQQGVWRRLSSRTIEISQQDEFCRLCGAALPKLVDLWFTYIDTNIAVTIMKIRALVLFCFVSTLSVDNGTLS